MATTQERQQQVQFNPRVSNFWKVSQLITYLVAFAGSVVAGITLGYVVKKFKGNCPLYTANANISLSNETLYFSSSKLAASEVIGTHVMVGDDGQSWSPSQTCDFATFTPVAGAVYAFIMAYFIAMCDRPEKVGRGSRSHNRMSGLFIPILLMSLIFSILMLVSSVRTYRGAQIFCSGVHSSLSKSCSEVQYYPWIGFPLTTKFYNVLLTSVISSWVGAVGYFASVSLLLARCFSGVDYKNANSPKSSPTCTPSPQRRRNLYESRSSPRDTDGVDLNSGSDQNNTPLAAGDNIRRRRPRRRRIGRDGRQPKSDGSPLIDDAYSESLSSRSPSPPPSPLFESPLLSEDRPRRKMSPPEPLDSSTPFKTPPVVGATTTTTEAQITIT